MLAVLAGEGTDVVLFAPGTCQREVATLAEQLGPALPQPQRTPGQILLDSAVRPLGGEMVGEAFQRGGLLRVDLAGFAGPPNAALERPQQPLTQPVIDRAAIVRVHQAEVPQFV